MNAGVSLGSQLPLFFYLLGLCLPSGTCSAATFELEAGSLIGLAGGNPQPLSGTFTLDQGVPYPCVDDPAVQCGVLYHLTALQFQSASLSFALNPNYQSPLVEMQDTDGVCNNVQFRIWVDSASSPFQTLVLEIPTMPGLCFYGSQGEIMRFDFPEATIRDLAGAQLGQISFSAIVVPEPSTFALPRPRCWPGISTRDRG